MTDSSHSNSTEAIMRQMVELFLEEARPMLSELEEMFLSLDAVDVGTLDPELMDRIFRIAHNLKGSSAAVGFDQMAHLAHGIEDVLSSIQKGKVKITQARLSVILKAIDVARVLLDLKATHPDQQHPLEEILSDLKEANDPSSELMNAGAPPRSAATPGAEADAAGQPVRSSGSGNGAPSGKAPEEKSLRVSTQKLDLLLNLVGELVVNQSMMISHRVKGSLESEHSVQTLRYIEKIVGELQTLSMTLRMVPIKPLFQKMNRVVRDTALSLSKEITVITDGDHVELDKIVLEQIVDPLTHLIRNAVDHGIEDAVGRAAAKKPIEGLVFIHAEQRDDQIQITVSDDGKGIDPKKIAAKAVEKSLITRERADLLTDQECFSLIFLPGFSTKEAVTDISGRGVGMDVVQRAVRELKGDIRIQSELGRGTKFIISLPLSLSIIPGLVVNVDTRSYVIPISQLVEIVELSKFAVQSSTQKGRMLSLRGEVIPVHRLGTLLHKSVFGSNGTGASAEYRPGVVISQQGRKVTYEVDEVVGQQQIVIKKLGPEFQNLLGILGGAVLSNGEPSMILDLAELVDLQMERNDGGAMHAA